jgi:hypothetical protein
MLGEWCLVLTDGRGFCVALRGSFTRILRLRLQCPKPDRLTSPHLTSPFFDHKNIRSINLSRPDSLLYARTTGNSAQQRHSVTTTALWRESGSIRCLLSTVQDASGDSRSMISWVLIHTCHRAISAISPSFVCLRTRLYGLTRPSRLGSR